jgi:poly-beta-1,6-N-acetyl-D-glucosamine biosynthesis protein PgaD
MNAHTWPPLILPDRVPRWVRARDLALTIVAWIVLLYWVRGALLLILDWLSYPFFELSTTRAPDWAAMWSTLAPFFAVSAVLAAWLVFWALQRRKTLMRQRTVAQPPPLELDAHARQFGLDARAVLAIRAPRVATVHFDAAGGIARPGDGR